MALCVRVRVCVQINGCLLVFASERGHVGIKQLSPLLPKPEWGNESGSDGEIESPRGEKVDRRFNENPGSNANGNWLPLPECQEILNSDGSEMCVCVCVCVGTFAFISLSISRSIRRLFRLLHLSLYEQSVITLLSPLDGFLMVRCFFFFFFFLRPPTPAAATSGRMSPRVHIESACVGFVISC